MRHNSKKILMVLIAAVSLGLLLGLIGPLFMVSSVDAENNKDAALHPHIFTVEIAENGTRFTPDEAPVFEEDGMPAFGSAFITQGYIYPEGTLTCDDEGNCNGVLPDGGAEFPDLVLGQWTCWGYHVGNGAHTETGPIVATTQLYSFGDEPGAETLTTIGYELVDFNTPFKRAITGGTGTFRNVGGEQGQELLGLNNADRETFGVSLRVSFDLEGVDIDTEEEGDDTE